MTRDPFQAGLNAISNCSATPVSRDDVIAILRGAKEPANFARALFGDCALETLERLAIVAGVSRAELFAAYREARRLHAARNPEIDELIDAPAR